MHSSLILLSLLSLSCYAAPANVDSSPNIPIRRTNSEKSDSLITDSIDSPSLRPAKPTLKKNPRFPQGKPVEPVAIGQTGKKDVSFNDVIDVADFPPSTQKHPEAGELIAARKAAKKEVREEREEEKAMAKSKKTRWQSEDGGSKNPQNRDGPPKSPVRGARRGNDGQPHSPSRSESPPPRDPVGAPKVPSRRLSDDDLTIPPLANHVKRSTLFRRSFGGGNGEGKYDKKFKSK
jgi:hypothetical protein